jgi:hypothetical protein
MRADFREPGPDAARCREDAAKAPRRGRGRERQTAPRAGATADWLDEYIADLRRRAHEREREGAFAVAHTYLFEQQELTTAEIVELTGYSDVQIRRMLRDGTITRRRGDLPRKPGHGVARPRLAGADRAASLAEDILRRGGRRKAS